MIFLGGVFAFLQFELSLLQIHYSKPVFFEQTRFPLKRIEVRIEMAVSFHQPEYKCPFQR